MNHYSFTSAINTNIEQERTCARASVRLPNTVNVAAAARAAHVALKAHAVDGRLGNGARPRNHVCRINDRRARIAFSNEPLFVSFTRDKHNTQAYEDIRRKPDPMFRHHCTTK